jgi:hypothetical protein
MLTRVRPSTADEYLGSFWARQIAKCPGEYQPPPDKRLERILGRYPHKFPCEGKRQVAWHIGKVSSPQELEQFWMHKSDTFLERFGLWTYSGQSHWLRDLARAAIGIGFFERTDTGRCGDNYRLWKGSSLKGRLDGDEKPLLVGHPYLNEIVDGFGRLLPYLALVYEGMEFYPFDAYLAIPA